MVTAARAASNGDRDLCRAGSQRGHALLMALVVLVISAAGSLLVTAALLSRMREVQDEAIDLKLTAFADAALAEALAQLAVGHDPEVDRAFTDGHLRSEVTDWQPLTRTLLITVDYAGSHRQIEVRVALEDTGPRVTSHRRLSVAAQDRPVSR
jgi:hypothetical protein